MHPAKSSNFLPALLLAFVCCSTLTSRAGPDTQSAWESNPAGWLDLQPSADLKGWTRVPIPPSGQLGRAQWHLAADRGVVVTDGDGGHEMLRYDRELGDCILHVEFRFEPVTSGKANYNSGVFIRNSADGTIWFQAQLAMDGGYWFGDNPAADGQLKRFNLRPLEKRMKPVGEWNTMEVTARGKVLTTWLNGAVTSVFPDCNAPRGYIALESEGYHIEFRNLKLKELGAKLRG